MMELIANYTHLFGMSWEGALQIDTVLPFGLRSAPKMFNPVADVVEWIVCQHGVDTVFHYVFGPYVVGNAQTEKCAVHLSVLRSLFDYLGMPVAVEQPEQQC